MPRPMLFQQRQNSRTESTFLQPKQKTNSYTETDAAKLDHLLRKPRSKRYMELLGQLDTGGHLHNKEKVEQLINDLKAELPELELSGLKGYVSICYLGEPYEVHMLDLAGEILEHYPRGKALPNGLEKVRYIAMNGGYHVIEVYEDCCRAIGRNGQVSVIPL